MTLLTSWVERAAVFAIVATAVAVAFVLFFGAASPGRTALRSYVAALDVDLRFVRSRLRGQQVVVWQGAAAMASLLGSALGTWSVILALPVIAVAPRVVFRRWAKLRVARVEGLVEPWLNAIANSLKASPSLGDAIASTPTLVPAPMGQEIDVLVKECALGTPLDEALDNLAGRIGTPTLSGAVLALKVARRSGGNLTELLESSAAALRELARLEGVVRAKTAEGKAQAFVIGAIPAPLVLGVRITDPEFFRPLTESFLGNLLVAGATVLWALAVLSARKILAVEV